MLFFSDPEPVFAIAHTLFVNACESDTTQELRTSARDGV